MTRHAEMLGELEQALRDRQLLYVIMPDMREARGCAGFPDVMVAGINGLAAIEVKTRLDEPDAAQQLWAWAFDAYMEYLVWTDGEDLGQLLGRYVFVGAVPGATLLYR